jgi:ABC-2 type transport system ATP-binding protein
MQILIRCSQPALLASKVFSLDSAVEAKIHSDGGGLLVRTRDLDNFYDLINRIAAEGQINIEAVAPADDDANSIYQYLIGSDGSNA